MYCIYCGKNNNPEQDTCKYCGKELIKRELDESEMHMLSKKLHDNLNAAKESFDNAMVFVILGAIFLAIGALFFFLAYKLPTPAAHDKELTAECFEFWVSMAGLGLGSIGLIMGLIRVFIQVRKQKAISRVLRAVQHGKYIQLYEEEMARRAEAKKHAR
ncbi:MAG: hypothetical protein MJ217_02365 [Bacilli bacterium]|nr:hypothetical protein [Bacilli bacterium]